MQTAKTIIEVALFVTAAAGSAVIGGALLATFRVMISSRRRLQFKRLWAELQPFAAIRTLLTESPDSPNDSQRVRVRAT